jgi:hypothetical protein
MLCDEVPIESRDFTEGKATALMEQLQALGAKFVAHQADLPSLLNISKDVALCQSEQEPARGHLKPKK